MTGHSAAPRSRRERPAKPALTRDGIVTTAVELLRAEGLRRVTMRRLAQELDTGPASLYVYVRDAAELHAAILDRLLGAVDLGPVHAAGDWRERLEAVLTSYLNVLFTYPGLAQSALVTRPHGEHYLNLIEALLALLDEGGVPSGQAAWGVDALLQYATATAAEHAPGAEGEGADSEEQWNALRAAVHGVPPGTRPHLTAVTDDLLTGSPESRIAWGFHVLINGIANTPRP
ncbi:TetR/AcrR family transcriptional regulator C-terminal domain-containing protein [Actinoallomurus liliacearum]|uniref:TetR/AcrR family transcriptional regulator C-terminal domain-containing protein n=1 Tax=Actinoallomurus liliacearum TaxID=1080073 RepID=A0ABP8TE67_9ACTN